MSSFMVGPGIRFNDFLFSEPVALRSWEPPRFAGLFVLLVADASWAPRQFQPLCFAEFGNNARIPAAADSRRIPTNGSLYVSVLPLPFSTSSQRCEARDQLVSAYNPVYQSSAAPMQNELVRKLDVLEKKHDEQTTQFQLLLASINRLFEPQPERPHRPIGFLPQAD
jgi:hypothetical protein